MNYYGSAKGFDIYPFTDKNTKRTILEICYSKKYLTIAEVKWILKYDAVNSDEFANSNILGKFYKKDFQNCS